MQESKSIDEEKYPSIGLAYEIGLKSYDWCIQRSDSMDGTIDRLMAWFSSITLAVVTLVAGKGSISHFENPWFYLTCLFFVLIITAGIYSKRGSLSLVSPKELFEKNLHRQQWDFKRTILYWAGRDFELNQSLVNRKGQLSTSMIVFFVIEGLTIWRWLTSL